MNGFVTCVEEEWLNASWGVGLQRAVFVVPVSKREWENSNEIERRVCGSYNGYASVPLFIYLFYACNLILIHTHISLR